MVTRKYPAYNIPVTASAPIYIKICFRQVLFFSLFSKLVIISFSLRAVFTLSMPATILLSGSVVFIVSESATFLLLDSVDFLFSDPAAFEVPGAEKVKIDTLSYFKTALRAKVWITNVNIERGLHFKKKSQIYLNSWHGTGPKASGNAVKGRNDYDFSYVDIICVDGQHTRNQMINDYNACEENLIFSGRPREDELYTFNDTTTDRVRTALNIPIGKKILLYMPTWREHGNLELKKDLWEKCSHRIILHLH